MPKPKWERGYRSHGYWCDGQRLGHVGIGPGTPHNGPYFWSIDGTFEEGREKTLRAAKNAVERRVNRQAIKPEEFS